MFETTTEFVFLRIQNEFQTPKGKLAAATGHTLGHGNIHLEP